MSIYQNVTLKTLRPEGTKKKKVMNWSEQRSSTVGTLWSRWSSLNGTIQRAILGFAFFQPWINLYTIYTWLKNSDAFLFNEETLVAFTFLAFVLVSSRAISETLSQTFAERRTLIRKALALNITNKEQHLKALLVELETHRKLSQQAIAIKGLTIEKLHLFGKLQNIAQENSVRESVRQCLEHMINLDKKCQDEFQTAFLKGYIPSVRDTFRLGGAKAYSLDIQNTFKVLSTLSGNRKC
jgi:hypothetical protein